MKRALMALVFVACGDSAATTAAAPDGGTSPSTTDGGHPSTDASGGSDASTDSSSSASPCERPKPGPTTTGVPAGTVLKPSGTVTVDQDGAVIEDLDITGEIMVNADNVTIRRVKITSGDYYPIRYDDPHRGLVIEDSEIIGTSDDVTAAVSFAHYTARRVNVHGGADGFKADEDVLIEDCFIHDLRNGDGQHNDGVQSTGGKGVTLRHNVISGASNAAVQTGDEGAATEDLLIECSWLSGGGYTLNIRGTGATVPKNTRILNNRFGRDSAYGPWTLDDPSPTVTGNVYDDDGTPIPYP
jgi:hypothetical protein